METLIFLITAVLGSNAFTYYVQYRLNKKNKESEDGELLQKTLASVAYGTISNEIERLLTKEFATPDERHTLNILFDAYKANGWNGDMDARMEKVYRMRTDRADEAETAESACKTEATDERKVS